MDATNPEKKKKKESNQLFRSERERDRERISWLLLPAINKNTEMPVSQILSDCSGPAPNERFLFSPSHSLQKPRDAITKEGGCVVKTT